MQLLIYESFCSYIEVSISNKNSPFLFGWLLIPFNLCRFSQGYLRRFSKGFIVENWPNCMEKNILLMQLWNSVLTCVFNDDASECIVVSHQGREGAMPTILILFLSLSMTSKICCGFAGRVRDAIRKFAGKSICKRRKNSKIYEFSAFFESFES